MKARFIDIRNCHALLPTISKLPLVQRLEHCLCHINDRDPNYKGIFDKFLMHNSRSLNLFPTARRLVQMPLDIVQIAYVSERSINTVGSTFPDPSPSRLHIGLRLNNDLSWKVIVPIQYLLKGWGDANKGYQGYIHSITHNVPDQETFEQLHERQKKDVDSYYYMGITGRNWLQRLNEHIGEMHRGSGKRFHKAWRESLGMKHVQIVSSLMAVNMTYDEAMDWEEREVDRAASDKYGLNMIPGGFKGLKFLHKHRITKNIDINLDERDAAIAEYLIQNPRKGRPNPIISELWKDNAYYLRINESHPRRLSEDQVRSIRRLAKDKVSVADIRRQVGALNERQVTDVINGKTYIRVD